MRKKEFEEQYGKYNPDDNGKVSYHEYEVDEDFKTLDAEWARYALYGDTIPTKVNLYDVMGCLHVQNDPEIVNAVYVLPEDEITARYDHVREIADWLTDYKKTKRGDRLQISDVMITGSNAHHFEGTVFVVNGMNGCTQVSRQSLNHIMDIIQHLEDWYGARAFISQVSVHNDVFYYAVKFVVWRDILYSDKTGNLRKLHHDVR